MTPNGRQYHILYLLLGSVQEHFYSRSYDDINKNWKSLFFIKRTHSLIFILVGVVSAMVGIVFNVHFMLDFRGEMKDTEINNAFWVLLGVLFGIVGTIELVKSYFYKNKLSRVFKRRLFEKDPAYLIEYYQVLYDLRKALIEHEIQYTILSPKIFGRIKAMEFRLIGKPFSIIIEPIMSSKRGYAQGVIVSLGPHATKDDPDVWKVITIVEETLMPRPGF